MNQQQAVITHIVKSFGVTDAQLQSCTNYISCNIFFADYAID
jgi:hypothetical protein